MKKQMGRIAALVLAIVMIIGVLPVYAEELYMAGDVEIAGESVMEEILPVEQMPEEQYSSEEQPSEEQMPEEQILPEEPGFPEESETIEIADDVENATDYSEADPVNGEGAVPFAEPGQTEGSEIQVPDETQEPWTDGQDQGPETQDQGSETQDQGTETQDQGTETQDQGIDSQETDPETLPDITEETPNPAETDSAPIDNEDQYIEVPENINIDNGTIIEETPAEPRISDEPTEPEAPEAVAPQPEGQLEDPASPESALEEMEAYHAPEMQWGDLSNEYPQDSNDLLQCYFDQQLFGATARRGENAGALLGTKERIAYDYVKAAVEEIASGDRSSTVIEVPLEAFMINIPQPIYESDLGLSVPVYTYENGQFVENAAAAQKADAALNAMYGVDWEAVIRAVFADCPYEIDVLEFQTVRLYDCRISDKYEL